MRIKNKHPSTVTYAVLLAAGLCANEAFATPSVASQINQICQAAGNPMIVSTSSCTACHDDGNGGSGAGKTAARGSNATILSFFCPDVTIPDPPATCTDADGDGFAAEGGNCGQMDCNDNDPAIHPGASESCTDGVDNNCNNLVDAADPNAAGCPVVNCTDADGDGYAIEGGICGPVDCDDSAPDVNPGQIEICDDGIDNNCDANTDAVDATCQVLQEGNDPVLEGRHDRARRAQRGERGENGYPSDRRSSRRRSGDRD